MSALSNTPMNCSRNSFLNWFHVVISSCIARYQRNALLLRIRDNAPRRSSSDKLDFFRHVDNILKNFSGPSLSSPENWILHANTSRRLFHSRLVPRRLCLDVRVGPSLSLSLLSELSSSLLSDDELLSEGLCFRRWLRRSSRDFFRLLLRSSDCDTFSLWCESFFTCAGVVNRRSSSRSSEDLPPCGFVHALSLC